MRYFDTILPNSLGTYVAPSNKKSDTHYSPITPVPKQWFQPGNLEIVVIVLTANLPPVHARPMAGTVKDYQMPAREQGFADHISV
jgi:hypothetical protein